VGEVAELGQLARVRGPVDVAAFRAACARAAQHAREVWAQVRRIVRAWWARVVEALRPIRVLQWRLATADARRRAVRRSSRHDPFAYRTRRMLRRTHHR